MNLTVNIGEKQVSLQAEAGDNILNILKKNDIYVPAYCNGQGSCGKCGIIVENGQLEITAEDTKFFDEAQIKRGYRLSCKAVPKEDVTIRMISSDEDDFEVLSSHGAKTSNAQKRCGDGMCSDDANVVPGICPEGVNTVPDACVDDMHAGTGAHAVYGIAVDIGTTTISMDLINLATGISVADDNRINRQRAFGADVISRIQASVNGDKEALRKSIIKDLTAGFEHLVNESGIAPAQIDKIVIGANTTMCHLLLDYDCDTLGVFPFDPVNIKTVRKSFEEVFDSTFLGAQVIVLPGISTYVGADIAAGLLACDFDRSEQQVMLIDLGTNGEMAISTEDGFLCTSTAAGPAFEGGNISCGTGSIRGAICAVKIHEPDNIEYKTIADGAPVGICGTGVLDITAELVACEMVDETGLLDDDYFDKGVKIATSKTGEDIVFTQKDVREIQLAKAAVRAGIEVLVKRSHKTFEDVGRVYLAGGFGFRLNIEKAVSIGLLPEAFADKICIVGNSCLKGASMCVMNENNIARIEAMIAKCQEISLGSDVDFNNAYMESMYFE